jgi:hypothetical protein
MKRLPKSLGGQLKRLFLICLFASVMVTACAGCFAIVSANFGWLQARILLTTLSIALASVAGLACTAYLETRRGVVLPAVGVVLTLVGLVMVLITTWGKVVSEGWAHSTISICVLAVACAHLSLLSLCRLVWRYQIAMVFAYVAILGVAGIMLAIVWGELHSMEVYQVLGVAAIFDAAVTIVVPVLHRLSAIEGDALLQNDPFHRQRLLEEEISQLKVRLADLERARIELVEAEKYAPHSSVVNSKYQEEIYIE